MLYPPGPTRQATINSTIPHRTALNSTMIPMTAITAAMIHNSLGDMSLSLSEAPRLEPYPWRRGVETDGLHGTLATPGHSRCHHRGSNPRARREGLALVRLAAQVAVDGAGPSYGHGVDTALGAGVTAEEIVDMLVGVIPIIGLPGVVAATPKLAMALGYDTDEAFAPQSAG